MILRTILSRISAVPVKLIKRTFLLAKSSENLVILKFYPQFRYESNDSDSSDSKIEENNIESAPKVKSKSIKKQVI
jgi:hypothetical protein